MEMLELIVLLQGKVAGTFSRLLLRCSVVFGGGWISGETDVGFCLMISGFG